jgi:hypothetical protein
MGPNDLGRELDARHRLSDNPIIREPLDGYRAVDRVMEILAAYKCCIGHGV